MRFLSILLVAVSAYAREWSSEVGAATKFQAELHGFDSPNVILRAPDGRTAVFPLAQFSAADRDYVKARLPGLLVGAMTPPNVGQKAGAGWGRPVSADPSDCDVTETADGFHSKHFIFKTSEKMPTYTQRDLAEACEIVHEIFRVAPWGVLATPKHDGRFQISVLPRGQVGTNRDVFDRDGTLRIAFGAAGLEKIGSEWVRDERPDAGRDLKEFVSYMLMRDVIGLVPPWLPEALADSIAEIPTVGGTAWCAEVPAGLPQKVKSVHGPSLTILAELLTPPRLKPVVLTKSVPPSRPAQNDAVLPSRAVLPDSVTLPQKVLPESVQPLQVVVPSSASPALVLTRLTPARPSGEEAELDEEKRRKDHALMIAYYYSRLADGSRAQQITRVLRQALEDRPKWDDFDAEMKAYKEAWGKLKVLPGAKRWMRILGVSHLAHRPKVPVPPHHFENGEDLRWLLLPLLLEKKTPAAVAAEISAKIGKS